MTTIGLLPAKCFLRGKSRLSSVLDAEARARIARTLFTHVLQTAKASGALDEIVVVTDGDDVAAVAAAHGAKRMTDPPATHLGEVVDGAIAQLASRADAVVVLMGDLPLLTTSDVHTLVRRLDRADLVVAPDSRDEGTNAVAMRLSIVSKTQLGHGDSFARHSALAGFMRVDVLRSDGLGLDVDTVADFERWRGMRPAQVAARNRTRSSRVSER